MKKNYIIITILLFSFIKIFPQVQPGSITGNVIDAETRQPVIGANVIIQSTLLGAATDEQGNFTINNIPPDVYQVKISAIGYNTITRTDVTVNPSRPLFLEIELTDKVIELEGVVVESGFFSNNPQLINSTKSFTYEEIRRAPGGFEDIIRALSVLPGVAQADPGRNDLVVRGGAPSENLYIIDGIEVQNINHFGTQGASGGSLTYLNLDYVKGTDFSTGGFPVLYGDKISSVLSIDLRQGRNDKTGGKATISASQFGFNLEGPLSSSSNFIFSARRSYLDFIFKAAGFGFVPEYYDLLSKFNFNLDTKNTLSFLFTGAFDKVKYFNDTEDQRWDNSRVLGSNQTQYVSGITYRHLFNTGFFNIILSRNYIDYDTRQRDYFFNPLFTNVSREQVNGLRGDVVLKLSQMNELNIGGKIEYIKFNADVLFPSFITSFGDTLPDNSLNAADKFYKSSAYVNLVSSMFGRITANFGIRGDYFSGIEDKFYFSPRFSASYSLSELTRINLSTGIYYQSPSYLWLLGNSSNRNLKNIKSEQLVLGIEHFLREDLLLKVEAFLKNYSNYPASIIRPYLILANTGAGYSGSDDNFSSFGLEPLVSKGKGTARGVEFSAQKKLSNIPVYGLLSLTYSKTTFTPLDGIERPGTYDQQWLFSLSGGYKIDEFWEAALKFRFSSGKPSTPFNPDGTQDVLFYNTQRLKSFHALDLRLDKRWFFEHLTLITYLDIQNVYNNKNSSFVRWDKREQKIDSESSIGILPSIGISLEF